MTPRNIVLFDHVIADFPSDGTWVELGSWTGRSAAYCVVELLNRSWQGRFVCVDNWQGGQELANDPNLENIRERFENNIKPIAKYIELIEGQSWESAELFQDGSVDFCYVDAAHDYDSVTKDLKSWWPRIRSGCCFAGDDYTKGYPDLQRAVWDFFGEQQTKVSRIGRCWFVKKP